MKTGHCYYQSPLQPSMSLHSVPNKVTSINRCIKAKMAPTIIQYGYGFIREFYKPIGNVTTTTLVTVIFYTT